MVVKEVLRKIILVISAGIWSVVPTIAQTALLPPQQPKRASTPARTTATVVLDNKAAAPQVVTIIHRLNGLKMFRLLLRSEDQVQAIASLDDAFKFMEDVHTNVIAGLALDDGQSERQ